MSRRGRTENSVFLLASCCRWYGYSFLVSFRLFNGWWYFEPIATEGITRQNIMSRCHRSPVSHLYHHSRLIMHSKALTLRCFHSGFIELYISFVTSLVADWTVLQVWWSWMRWKKKLTIVCVIHQPRYEIFSKSELQIATSLIFFTLICLPS